MSGDKLDDAIDGAVREIMGTEPPAGLRQRVIRRLAEPERRAWFAVPRLAFVAAVLLAVAVGAVVMLTMNRGRTSPPIEVAVAPQPSGPAGPAVAAPEVTQNRLRRIAARATAAARRRPYGNAAPESSDERSCRRRRSRTRTVPWSLRRSTRFGDRPRTGGVRRRPDGRHRNCAAAAMEPVEDRAVVVNAALSGFEVRMLKQTVTHRGRSHLADRCSRRAADARAEPARPAPARRRQPTATGATTRPRAASTGAGSHRGQPRQHQAGDHDHRSGRARRAGEEDDHHVVADRSERQHQIERHAGRVASGRDPSSINVDAHADHSQGRLDPAAARARISAAADRRTADAASAGAAGAHVEAQRADLRDPAGREAAGDLAGGRSADPIARSPSSSRATIAK